MVARVGYLAMLGGVAALLTTANWAQAADYLTTPAYEAGWTGIYVGIGGGYTQLNHDLRATYDLDICAPFIAGP